MKKIEMIVEITGNAGFSTVPKGTIGYLIEDKNHYMAKDFAERGFLCVRFKGRDLGFEPTRGDENFFWRGVHRNWFKFKRT